MSGSQIDEIKSRISIEEIVGEHVELSLAGKNLKGLCPFHNEKTPSFVVSPDRGTYYCFGCGAKGDIFSFLQEYQGMEFKESLKNLADRAGVVLDNFSAEDKKEYDERYEVLELATSFFEDRLLESKQAKDYVIDRGISSEVRNQFRIGYAPNDWHLLHQYLEKKKKDIKVIEEVGLAKKGDKGVYDHFRDRIMFPIFDERGKVIAFSGRLLNKDEKSAKYVNSPESSVFHKSEVLFGLNFARQEIRKKDEIVLVEGQVDLIMAHQAGTKNSVATSGTAFTKEHAAIIKKYTDNVVIAYDGDTAGQKAAARAWEILLEEGVSVKVAEIGDGQDPADLIVKDKDAWLKIISKAKPLIEYMTEKIYSVISDPHKRIKLIEEKVLPKLKYINSNVEKSYFISYLSQKTGIKEELLWHHTGKEKKEIKKENINIEAYPLEEEMMSLLVWQKNIEKDKRAVDIDEVFKKIEGVYRECEIDFKYPEEIKEEKIFEFEERWLDSKILEKHINEVLVNLSRELIKNKISILSGEMEGDYDKSDQNMIKIHKLTKMSKEISG